MTSHPTLRMDRMLPLGSGLADTADKPQSGGYADGPVRVNLPLTGSYNSGFGCKPQLPPPSMKTLPFGSNTATCQALAAAMLPVGVNVPVRGSYNSALLSKVV